MPKHKLTWRKNRSTPIVTPAGQKLRPERAGEGPVVKTRMATDAEEKQISSGKWVRIRKDGKQPNDKGAASSKLPGRPKLKKTTAMSVLDKLATLNKEEALFGLFGNKPKKPATGIARSGGRQISGDKEIKQIHDAHMQAAQDHTALANQHIKAHNAAIDKQRSKKTTSALTTLAKLSMLQILAVDTTKLAKLKFRYRTSYGWEETESVSAFMALQIARSVTGNKEITLDQWIDGTWKGLAASQILYGRDAKQNLLGYYRSTSKAAMKKAEKFLEGYGGNYE